MNQSFGSNFNVKHKGFVQLVKMFALFVWFVLFPLFGSFLLFVKFLSCVSFLLYVHIISIIHLISILSIVENPGFELSLASLFLRLLLGDLPPAHESRLQLQLMHSSGTGRHSLGTTNANFT